MSEQANEVDWTARHARTRPTERQAPVVRVETDHDDWSLRHAETSR